MNDQQWYYESNGEQAGPISWDGLMVGIKMGKVTPETRVWAAHLHEWTTLGDCIRGQTLPPTPSQSHQQEVLPTRKRWTTLHWIATGIAILILFFVGIGITRGFTDGFSSKAEKIVKTGHFKSHPEKTVGKAVNDFFGNPRWESGTGSDGETKGKSLVSAKGRIKYMDRDVSAHIQFVVDETDGSFELRAFEINEIPQNKIMILSLINKMYE